MDKILAGLLLSHHNDSIKSMLITKLIFAVERQETSQDVVFNLISTSIDYIINTPLVDSDLNKSLMNLLSVCCKSNSSAVPLIITPEKIGAILQSERIAAPNVLSILHIVVPNYIHDYNLYNQLSEFISNNLAVFISNHCNGDRYILNELLTICLQNPNFLPRSSLDRSCSLIKILLRYLSTFHHGLVSTNPAEFISMVETVASVVEALWSVSNENALRQTISLLFSFIADDTSPEEPYLPFSSVVKHINVNYIPQCVSELVDIYENDEKAVKIILYRLTNFLRWPKSAHIDHWILMFILKLAEKRKTVFVLEYIREYVVSVIRLLPLRGINRQSVTTIFEFMLLTHQHNHDLVELVAKELPCVCNSLRDENSPSSLRCLETLAEVGHILTYMHKIDVSTMPKDVVRLLHQYPRPNKEYMLKRIKAHKWSKIAQLDFTKQIEQKSETGCVGLLNIGNTCYANAALQLLYNCIDFRKAVLNRPTCITNDLISSQLYNLFSSLENSKALVSDPGTFVRNTRPKHFIPGEQQDAAEYLGHLLDCLHEEETARYKANMVVKLIPDDHICAEQSEFAVASRTTASHDNTIQTVASVNNRSHDAETLVQSLFQGRVDRRTVCKACQHESKNRETFTLIFLPLTTNDSNPGSQIEHCIAQSVVSPSVKADISAVGTGIDSGVESGVPIEDVGRLVHQHLSGSVEEIFDTAACENCGQKQGARCSSMIDQLPPYVIFCLNLFTFNRATKSCTKLLRRVKVPEFLPVSIMNINACGESPHQQSTSGDGLQTGYNLQGIVVHHGVSLSFGHYTCVCKVGVNWVWFDDDIASFTQLDKVGAEASATPYLLVYKLN